MALLIARHGMSYREAAETTLVEFRVYNMAYAIQQEERRHQAAIQAWFNQSAKATKGKGKATKSAYRNFKDFYDHQKEFNKLFEPVGQARKRLSMAEKNRLMNRSRKEVGRVG